MSANTPRALVVVGAGASSACADSSSTCDEAWRPPLASQLFDMSKRSTFEAHLAAFPGAAALAPTLCAAEDFEEELTRLMGHHDPQTKAQCDDIPSYLCSVIRDCCTKFTRLPGVYVRLARRLICDESHEALFINLNYDDLLERALSLIDEGFRLDSVEGYIRTNSRFSVVKLHGSATWFATTTPVRGLKHEPRDDDWLRVPTDQPLPLPLYRRDGRMDATTKMLRPLLTAPVTEKLLPSSACPAAHMEQIDLFTSKPFKLLFLGTSGKDADVHEIVSKALRRSRCPMFQIADPRADDVGARIIRGAKLDPFRSHVEAIQGGFADYVKGEDFNRFLRL